MYILGIETSCDETAVAIVAGDRKVYANLVFSQIKEHQPYGGIVPEIAARSHLHHLETLISQALVQAALDYSDLDGIAATLGPGLIGGLIVGSTMAKSIALVTRKPFLAVNHLEAHALTIRLIHPLEFPYLLLLVSGGHCQLLVVKGVGRYECLGTTLDDAVGEAFDKVAKLLDLGYPGGPAIEHAALRATHPERFTLPTPMLGRDSCDFSFSGLKTAVSRLVADSYQSDDTADLAYAFQNAVSLSLCDRCRTAIVRCRKDFPTVQTLVVAGGVAANQVLRTNLAKLAQQYSFNFLSPPTELCTDNAAMVAWAGLERLRRGQQDPLSTPPKPRWPLDRS